MYTEKQQAKEGSYMDETGLENYVRTITAIADDAVKKLRENPEAHDRFENAMRLCCRCRWRRKMRSE